MAFVAVRGGKPVEDELDFGEAQEQEGQENPSDGDRDPADFEEAFLLNQKLKAMLAEAEAAHANPPPGQGRSAANSGRGSHRRAPKAPPSSGYPPTPTGGAHKSQHSAGYPRESSEGINRRKADQKIHQENAGIAVRLAGSKSCILPPLNLRPGGQESSQAINRRKFAEKVQRENASLVSRIEQPGRTRSLGPPRAVGESKLPPGWTRGIGGRAMPPPKLRWGTKPKFDAGDWAD